MFFKQLILISIIATTLGMNGAAAMSSNAAAIPSSASSASSISLTDTTTAAASASSTTAPSSETYVKPASKLKRGYATLSDADSKEKTKRHKNQTAKADSKEEKAIVVTDAPKRPKSLQLRLIAMQKEQEKQTIEDTLLRCALLVEEEIVIGGDSIIVPKLDAQKVSDLFTLLQNQRNHSLLSASALKKALMQAYTSKFDLAILLIIAHTLSITVDVQSGKLLPRESTIIPLELWESDKELNSIREKSFSVAKIRNALDQAIWLEQWEVLSMLLQNDAICSQIDPCMVNGIFMQAVINYDNELIVQSIAKSNILGPKLTPDTRTYVYGYVLKNHCPGMVDILDAAPYGKPVVDSKASKESAIASTNIIDDKSASKDDREVQAIMSHKRIRKVRTVREMLKVQQLALQETHDCTAWLAWRERAQSQQRAQPQHGSRTQQPRACRSL